MARIEVDPNYSSPTFSRATASSDLFKKEDVQKLAEAMSTHTHATGKGAALEAGSIPAGSITSGMIADATIDTADLKDGAVTSAKIADGAVTNAKLAADTARANLLTNGGFEIWQRGAGPFTANNAYSSDRWLMGLAGSDTLSVSRDTTSVDTGSGAAAACTFGLGTGAGGTCVYQVCENYVQYRGRELTASVRVRTTAANAVRIGLYDGITNTYSSFHTGGGTYQTLTITQPISATANQVLLFVFFAASCTAYLDNAMLVVGSVPADYAPLHPADDLARCLRYYENYQTVSGSSPIPLQVINVAQGIGPFNYKVQKAVTPTITFAGVWNATQATGSQIAGTASASSVSTDGFQASLAGLTGMVAGNASMMVRSAGGGAMYIEANP